MYRDINQEDIATALKKAGAARTFVDRQDYVTVLKELGSTYKFIDDQDLLKSVKQGGDGNGGDGDVAILKKEFPNMTGLMDTEIALFQCDGPVSVNCYAFVHDDILFIVGEQFGPELIVNGVFDGADGWNLGAGWSIPAGAALCTPPDEGDLSQDGLPIIEAKYKLIADITGTTGQFEYGVGGVYTAMYPPFGLLDVNVTVYEALPFIAYFVPREGFDGTVDNVSVRLILATKIEVGVDGDEYTRQIFMEANNEQHIEDHTLIAGALWQNNDVRIAPSPMNFNPVYLDGHTIKMFVRGGAPVISGAMTIFCNWSPLEGGATVTVL